MSNISLTSDNNQSALNEYSSNGNQQNSRNSYQTRRSSTTASTLIFSDLCEKHGDRLIAYDVSTGEIICNRCVYSRDQTHFQFSSTIAKKVSITEKQKYAELEKAITNLQEVAPHKISSDLQNCVSGFLEDVLSEIQAFESEQYDADNENITACHNQILKGIESMNADIQKSKNIKDRIDKYLNDSFFTHLAKQQIFVKKEIKNCELIGQRIDKSLHDGLEFKRQREEKFQRNNDALKKVLEDVSSCEVIKLISSSEPFVAEMDSRMYNQVNGENKQPQQHIGQQPQQHIGQQPQQNNSQQPQNRTS